MLYVAIFIQLHANKYVVCEILNLITRLIKANHVFFKSISYF